MARAAYNFTAYAHRQVSRVRLHLPQLTRRFLLLAIFKQMQCFYHSSDRHAECCIFVLIPESSFVQLMTWHQYGNDPKFLISISLIFAPDSAVNLYMFRPVCLMREQLLSEPMMTQMSDVYVHICTWTISQYFLQLLLVLSLGSLLCQSDLYLWFKCAWKLVVPHKRWNMMHIA